MRCMNCGNETDGLQWKPDRATYRFYCDGCGYGADDEIGFTTIPSKLILQRHAEAVDDCIRNYVAYTRRFVDIENELLSKYFKTKKDRSDYEKECLRQNFSNLDFYIYYTRLHWDIRYECLTCNKIYLKRNHEAYDFDGENHFIRPPRYVEWRFPGHCFMCQPIVLLSRGFHPKSEKARKLITRLHKTEEELKITMEQIPDAIIQPCIFCGQPGLKEQTRPYAYCGSYKCLIKAVNYVDPVVACVPETFVKETTNGLKIGVRSKDV